MAACATAPVDAQSPGYAVWSAFGTASYNIFAPALVDGYLGASVAVIGDVDFDGRAEVAVQSGLGAFVKVLSGATGGVLYSIAGTSGSELGFALVPLPDMNLDGVPDFGVGAPGLATSGFLQNGRFEVRSGVNGAVLWSVFGTGTYERLGSCGAEIGDLDFDGTVEVCVGASGGGGGLVGITNYGGAYVYSGATGALLRSYPSPPGYSLGRTVSKLGDVDLDGVPDALLVAGPSSAPCAGVNALASVVSGATGLPMTVVSHPMCTGFGASSAGLGDVDGDGRPDFAVGAPAALSGVIGAGEVRIYSGLTGAYLRSFFGASVGAYFGSALAGGRDLDADGRPDLLIGAPEPTVAGGTGRVVVVDPGLGTTRMVLVPAAPAVGSRFGQTVAVGDDLDGDGVPDAAIGAPATSTGGLGFNGRVDVRAGLGFAGPSFPFGVGCAPPGGAAAVLRFAGGLPDVTFGNSSFGIAVTGGPPGGGAMLILGNSNATYFGGALPADLSGYGFPGCSLYVSPEMFLLGDVGGAGATAFPIPAPVAPGLAGATVYVQALTQPAAAPAAAAFTAALAVVLQ
jgi:hypothetical protein